MHSEETLLADARQTVAAGCYTIRSQIECCASFDGRANWASNCVPGRFGNGNVCEPQKWVHHNNKQRLVNSCSADKRLQVSTRPPTDHG